MNTKLGEISVQIFTEIEQNHDCFIDDSDYSSPVFLMRPYSLRQGHANPLLSSPQIKERRIPRGQKAHVK